VIPSPTDHLKLRATSHTRLKALDHGNVRALIGQKAETVQVHVIPGGEGLKAQKKVCVLHGVLHGGLWIRVHGLPDFCVRPTSKRWV
jgi:hypothetical protein